MVLYVAAGAAYLHYRLGVSLDALIIAGLVGTAALISIAANIIVRWILPKANAATLPMTKISAPVEAEQEKLVEGLNIRIKELEGELKEETKKYKFELSQKEGLREYRDSLESRLGAHKWLHEMAQIQAHDIGSYVKVEKVYFCYHKLKDTIPLIIFGVDIYNKSVFNIVIEDVVEGHIEIAGKPLLRDKRLIYNQGIISSSSKGTLTIEQRLSPEEAHPYSQV